MENEDNGSGAQATVRLREWFPETLLWRPELITDDNGQVSIDVRLADSITSWRVSTSAVSAEGSLGGSESSIRVFQPFFVDLNLPVALTRGDEITIPVVVYNYLDSRQTVDLSLEADQWFERLDDADNRVELEPDRDLLSPLLRGAQKGTHRGETETGSQLEYIASFDLHGAVSPFIPIVDGSPRGGNALHFRSA